MSASPSAQRRTRDLVDFLVGLPPRNAGFSDFVCWKNKFNDPAAELAARDGGDELTGPSMGTAWPK
jgi:hypothetical protein